MQGISKRMQGIRMHLWSLQRKRCSFYVRVSACTKNHAIFFEAKSGSQSTQYARGKCSKNDRKICCPTFRQPWLSKNVVSAWKRPVSTNIFQLPSVPDVHIKMRVEASAKQKPKSGSDFGTGDTGGSVNHPPYGSFGVCSGQSPSLRIIWS